jgi:hypothetical protein
MVPWLPGTRDVCGFLLEWDGQELTKFNIGTALLHLGAIHFWPPYPRCFRFTFDSAGAVKVAKLWSHFKEGVASYQRAFQHAGLANKVSWLSRGVRTPIIV